MRANVLIVDDEESICWGLSRLLESEGHAASVASSAEEALARIAESPPDLIVMDVHPRQADVHHNQIWRRLGHKGTKSPSSSSRHSAIWKLPSAR